MADLSKAEKKYLKEKVHSSAGYIKYLQKKYDGKNLGDVTNTEWSYYHALREKERIARIKKGQTTLKDIRSTSRLEQEEAKKAKEYHKLKKIKIPKITPQKIPGQAPFRSDKYYGDKYLNVLKTMEKHEWNKFLKKRQQPPTGEKPLVKNLSAEEYLQYLGKKMKKLYTREKK